jgi:hypothetical protein
MPGQELEWGWHVLRNSTDIELNAGETIQRRNELEKEFFHTSAWEQLILPIPYESEKQIVGITALQKRVRQLLFKLNQDELPNVRTDIRDRLSLHEDRLKELGGERNPVQMRTRLRDGCRNLGRQAEDYSRGFYGNLKPTGQADEDNLKLRSRIRELSKGFNWTMQHFGHTFAPDHFALIPESDIDFNPSSLGNNRTAKTSFPPPKQMSQHTFYAQGLSFLDKNRGLEMNTYFDPHRISDLFKEQSAPWDSIAQHFLGQFYDKCETFLHYALRSEFRTEEDVPTRLRVKFLTRNMEERRREAENELGKLLKDRCRPINTESVEFLTRIRYTRSAKAFAGFNNALGNDEARRLQGGDGMQTVVDADVVAGDLGVRTTNQHERREAERFQDDMLTYYVIARTMFVDNFLMQVVERHLLDQMGQLFEDVHALSDVEVQEILREREDHRIERESLVSKIRRLRDAKAILT